MQGFAKSPRMSSRETEQSFLKADWGKYIKFKVRSRLPSILMAAAFLTLNAMPAFAQVFNSISNSLAVIMMFGFVLGISAVIYGGFAIRRGDVDQGKMSIIGGAITPLSSLSFSWSAFTGRTPERVRFRLIGVTTVRLPTPARVNRTRALHPFGHVWLWSDSRRGIWKLLNFLTHFESNGSVELHDRVFPARPHSRRIEVHEIEFQDYSPVGNRRITLKSLSRTGRVCLQASSSTGHEHDGW